MYLFVQKSWGINYKMVIERELNYDDIHHGRTRRNTDPSSSEKAELCRGKDAEVGRLVRIRRLENEIQKPVEQLEGTTISNLTPLFQFMIGCGFTLTGEDLEIIMTIIIHKEIAHGRITNNLTCHESQKRTS